MGPLGPRRVGFGADGRSLCPANWTPHTRAWRAFRDRFRLPLPCLLKLQHSRERLSNTLTHKTLILALADCRARHRKLFRPRTIRESLAPPRRLGTRTFHPGHLHPETVLIPNHGPQTHHHSPCAHRSLKKGKAALAHNLGQGGPCLREGARVSPLSPKGTTRVWGSLCCDLRTPQTSQDKSTG